MADQEEHNRTIAAWMRAIEALLMRIPEITQESIEGARGILDQNYKNKHKSTWELTARIKPNKPLDEDADAVLSRIEDVIKQREPS